MEGNYQLIRWLYYRERSLSVMKRSEIIEGTGGAEHRQGQLCPAEITEAERKLQEVLCKWSLRERVAP